MVEPLTANTKCPNCGTAMEILAYNAHAKSAKPKCDSKTNQHIIFVESPASEGVQWSGTWAQGGDILKYQNEQTAARLANERFLNGARPMCVGTDEAKELSFDEVIPPTLAEQALPFVAFMAVIVAFFALGSHEPVTFSVIFLNPLLVGLYLHKRSERRKQARGLLDSKMTGRTTSFRTLVSDLEESWQGISA